MNDVAFLAIARIGLRGPLRPRRAQAPATGPHGALLLHGRGAPRYSAVPSATLTWFLPPSFAA